MSMANTMRLKADEANKLELMSAYKMAKDYFYTNLKLKIEETAEDGKYSLVSPHMANPNVERFLFAMLKENGFKVTDTDIYNYTISWKESDLDDEC